MNLTMSESLKLAISRQNRTREDVENVLHKYSICSDIKNMSRRRLVDTKVNLEAPLQILQHSTAELISEIQDSEGKWPTGMTEHTLMSQLDRLTERVDVLQDQIDDQLDQIKESNYTRSAYPATGHIGPAPYLASHLNPVHIPDVHSTGHLKPSAHVPSLNSLGHLKPQIYTASHQVPNIHSTAHPQPGIILPGLIKPHTSYSHDPHGSAHKPSLHGQTDLHNAGHSIVHHNS